MSIEPWNGNYESPDIWVDRLPFGTFDNPNDGQGRPTGNGDKPQVLAINKFTARVHNQGTVDVTDIKHSEDSQRLLAAAEKHIWSGRLVAAFGGAATLSQLSGLLARRESGDQSPGKKR